MKRFFFTLGFIFFANILFSQSTIMARADLYKYDFIVVDSGNIRILYSLNAVDINDTKTYDDIQRLEIGSNLSKYYSYFIFRSDSLKKDFRRKNPNAQVVPNQSGEFGKKGHVWSLVIWSDYFKDFKKNTLTEFAHMPMNVPTYQCEENLLIQDWELHDDTLTVCGYLCQKATCRFRGNDFIAWFAPELPIPNGPWKLGGLPGLILKVNDKGNHYNFECIKIESHEKKFPIIMFDKKYYQKIARTTLKELEKDIHADYFKIGLVKVTTKDGFPVQFEPIPYNPLELE